MARRVNITETVESAAGLNITGASVVVRFHGGAQAPVYDSETAGSIQPQPLTSVNGKILASGTTPVWAAEGDYDLDVSFGSDATTFFLPLRRGLQFVTTLEATPEDGELAVELYDASNGGAWLKRFRGAASAWDMIGGPPPAGGVLPGTPRLRQEFYLTGGTPTVQHLRFNGSTWDYVGTPPTVPVTGSPLAVLDVGQFGQHRAGRQFTVADFTNLGLTTPVGLFNLGDTSNLGSGGALTNKGTVTFTTGIEGIGNTAAQFVGSTAQALYIADTGVNDPYRLRNGSVGCWFRCTKAATSQSILSKETATVPVFQLYVSSSNTLSFAYSVNGTSFIAANPIGTIPIVDDRWHFGVVTFDGTYCIIYVDGVVDSAFGMTGAVLPGASPFNIGGQFADASTAATNPFFGRIDEAFVTPDVLTEDQVRQLYAIKIPHGYSQLPTRAFVSVRRQRRGATLLTSDFPTTPLRLYNFTGGNLLTDEGSNNAALTNGGGSTSVAGADGVRANGVHFDGGGPLTATDTGLPSGLSSRSYGGWFKTTQLTSSGIWGWGTLTTGDVRFVENSTGQVVFVNGADVLATNAFLADGQWHHLVGVEDNAAADGAKRKLYMDGRMVASSTAMNSVTLAGAGHLQIGANPDGTARWPGDADGVFITSSVLTQEQIVKLYEKGTQAMGTSLVNPGDYVESIDTTSVYAIFDTIEPQHQVDLAVAA
jgi:hypothetical protein